MSCLSTHNTTPRLDKEPGRGAGKGKDWGVEVEKAGGTWDWEGTMQPDTGSCQVLEIKKINPHDSVIHTFNQPHSISTHSEEHHEADGCNLG